MTFDCSSCSRCEGSTEEAKMANATDKCRTGIPGVPGLGKVVNQTAWGEQTATERYGGTTQTFPPPKNQSMPQFKQDQCLDKTYNDVPENSWLRGGSQGGEGKPKFEHSRKR